MIQGQGELDQIDKIFKLIGSPNDDTWTDFHTLPNTSILRWKNKGRPKIYETFPINSFVGGQSYLDSNGFNLLQRLLTLDPKKRISAEDALNHAYFSEGVEMRTPSFFMHVV
jgi:cell division cycle 2-like protein